MAACSKRHVTEEDAVKEDLKKSRVDQREKERSTEGDRDEDWVSLPSAASGPDEVKTDVEEDGTEGSEATVTEYTIGRTLMLPNCCFGINATCMATCTFT